MKKVDPTVIKETKYILFWSVLMSILMQAVFLILQKWDYTVLLGNILGVAAGVGNFFLMGLTVQKALTQEKDAARRTAKVSQLYRMLMLIIVAIIGVAVRCFNMWSVIIALFFPRIAIMLRPLFGKVS